MLVLLFKRNVVYILKQLDFLLAFFTNCIGVGSVKPKAKLCYMVSFKLIHETSNLEIHLQYDDLR